MNRIDRRTFMGAISMGTALALAGCTGEDDEPSSEETNTPEPEDTETETETETEEPSSVCTGDTSDCTEEFAQTVLSEIEDSGDTPEPIDAGLHQDGESSEAALIAAFDLTNQSTFGRQLGNLVFEPIYENWPDYPETEEFYIGVFPTTDAEDRRTVVHVKKWWIDGLRDGDITVDEVTNNVLDTSTEPLSEVTDA